MQQRNFQAKNCITALVAVSSAFVFSSCVNEDYDLNKGIDTTIGIDAEIGAPLGSTGKIAVGDFFEIEEGSVVTADPQTGDYSIHVEAESPIFENVLIDRIIIDRDELVHDGGFDINANLYDEFRAAAGDGVTDDTDISSLRLTHVKAFQETEKTVDITVDEEVSEMARIVKSIGVINLDAPANLVFAVNEGAITFKAGFVIDFPEYVNVTLDDGQSGAEVRNGHELHFTEDMYVRSGNPIVYSLSINSIDVRSLEEDTDGQQGLVDTKIIINQVIALRDLYYDAAASDFGTTLGQMPKTAVAELSMNVLDVNVLGASAVIEPEFDIEPQRVEIGELPEFLAGDDIVLDIYNPVIRLDVSNTSPFPALVSATVNGLDETGNYTMERPLEIGSADADSENAILVNPGNTVIFLSVRGADLSSVSLPEGSNPPLDIVIGNFNDLLRRIPYAIELSDINVSVPHEGNKESGYTDSDYREMVYPADGGDISYDFSVDYSVNVPLAFGRDLQFTYPFDITGLGGTFGDNADEEPGMNVNFRNVRISLTLVNALPLELAVSVSPIDADGNEIPAADGLDFNILTPDGAAAVVHAGDIGKESSSTLVISGSADMESLKLLDGFRLNIGATVPEGELEGRCLNANQYIMISDMSVLIDGNAEFVIQ